MGSAVVCSFLLGDEPASAVRLTIDYGDGVQKTFTSLPWKEKMTVLEALKAAQNHPRGIKVTHTGSGAGVFITAIDDLANEGTGSRNWRYTVNDTAARVGAGAMALKAGDVVVWRFEK